MDRAISFRLSEEQLKKIDEYAIEHKRKRTDVIRLAIEAYIEPKST